VSTSASDTFDSLLRTVLATAGVPMGSFPGRTDGELHGDPKPRAGNSTTKSFIVHVNAAPTGRLAPANPRQARGSGWTDGPRNDLTSARLQRAEQSLLGRFEGSLPQLRTSFLQRAIHDAAGKRAAGLSGRHRRRRSVAQANTCRAIARPLFHREQPSLAPPPSGICSASSGRNRRQ